MSTFVIFQTCKISQESPPKCSPGVCIQRSVGLANGASRCTNTTVTTFVGYTLIRYHLTELYKQLQKQFPLLKLNFWTTVSSLNVENLPNILDFATENNIDHDWAFLNEPDALNVKYKNKLTLNAKEKLSNSSYAVCRDIANKIAIDKDNTEQLDLYIKRQDYIRKININNYLSF